MSRNLQKMEKMMQSRLVLAFLILTLLLAACGGGAEVPSLAGTSWKLVKIGDQPVVADTAPTLSFDENGQAGGNASCNQFGGSYEAKDGKLTFGPLVSTLMACATPGAMEQEAAYMAALAKVAGYTVTGDQLTLIDANGTLVAEFTK
jgi:heat shock protein HslJ